MKTKHVEKSLVDLWEQSLILKVVDDDCQGFGKDYMQRILTNKKLSKVPLCEVS